MQTGSPWRFAASDSGATTVGAKRPRSADASDSSDAPSLALPLSLSSGRRPRTNKRYLSEVMSVNLRRLVRPTLRRAAERAQIETARAAQLERAVAPTHVASAQSQNVMAAGGETPRGEAPSVEAGAAGSEDGPQRPASDPRLTPFDRALLGCIESSPADAADAPPGSAEGAGGGGPPQSQLSLRRRSHLPALVPLALPHAHGVPHFAADAASMPPSPTDAGTGADLRRTAMLRALARRAGGAPGGGGESPSGWPAALGGSQLHPLLALQGEGGDGAC